MNVQLIALVGFLVLQFGIGVWVSRRVATEDDYLVGGRKLGYVLVTFSTFATWFGAETVIGSAGEVYSGGLSLASAEPFGYALCLVLMGALLAKPLWDRGLTTLADLYRVRFGVRIERLAAIILIPTSVLWAAAQVRAFGTVLALVGGIDLTIGVGVAALFVIAYTTFGGLLADAYTDVIQGVVLSAGLIVTLAVVVLKVGGIGEAFTIIRTSDLINLAPSHAGPWYLTLEAWAIPVCGSLVATEVIGRVIGARSAVVAQRGTMLAGLLYLAIGSIPVLIALLARGLIGDLADPEQVLPTIASTLLSPMVFALFIGGLVSAILSTVDSTLLVASGLLSHNLIIPLAGITAERTKVLLARGGVMFFGLVAYLLAANADGVLALVEQASAFGSAGVLVTTLFALFTTLGSPRTAGATLVVALLVYLGAIAMESPVPFLASLGAALITWGLGCVTDSVAS